MKLEDLPFVARSDKYGQTPCLIMPGGFPVFKSTIELALTCVHLNWPNLDWAKKQSAESLIGSAVWQTQVHGAKLALGRCIMFFVRHDMLPLPLGLAKTHWGTPYRGGKRLYVLSNAAEADAPPSRSPRLIQIQGNRELLAHVNWAALLNTTPTTLVELCHTNH